MVRGKIKNILRDENKKSVSLELEVGKSTLSIDVSNFPFDITDGVVGRPCSYHPKALGNKDRLQISGIVYFFNPEKRDDYFVQSY